MLPITRTPETVRSNLEPYRDLFCRNAGFEQMR